MTLRIAVTLGLVGLFPLASYVALHYGVSSFWLGAADYGLALAILAAMTARGGRAGLRNTLLLLLGAVVAAAGLYAYDPAWLVYLPSMVIMALLAWLFHSTLRPGCEPLITRFARMERGGHLPEELVGYTRRLTWAWTLFFCGLLMESLALALAASMETYLLFANSFNYLFVTAFFLIEYLYRRIRYRRFPHASPRDFLRLLVNNRVLDSGRHS